MIHGDACFAYFNKIWGIPNRGRRPRFTPAESYRRDGNRKIADERIPAKCRAIGISR